MLSFELGSQWSNGHGNCIQVMPGYAHLMVFEVGVLITQEPNELLDTCHKTKLPDVVSWNLIKLAYEVL